MTKGPEGGNTTIGNDLFAATFPNTPDIETFWPAARLPSLLEVITIGTVFVARL